MNYIKLFVLVFFLGSCKSNYALLQESTPTYVKVKKRSIKRMTLLKVKKPVLADIKIKTTRKIEPTATYFPEVKVERKEVLIKKYKEETASEIFLDPDPKEKEKRKKKRKRNRFWRQMGSNLLIGLVFLGVAVVMAFIQLPSLTLLFGLASILFLIFGLKKVFKKRKRRIKNPFNKKK